jgi:hypothetical protein
MGMRAVTETGTRAGEAEILERCLEHLNLLDGLDVQFLPAAVTGSNQGGDGRLRLSGPWGQATYAVHVKRRINQDTLRTLLYQLKTAPHVSGARRLLMTHYISPDQGRQLRGEAIDYVDTAGNMSLLHPPLYVWISGRSQPASPPRASRLFQATGLRLIATLLQQTEALCWTYRDLSERSGVSLGAIGYILEELQEKGYARVRATGQLELVNRTELFQRWEQGYAEQLRPRLFLETCRPAIPAAEKALFTSPELSSTGIDGPESTPRASLEPELELLCRRIVDSGLQDRLRVGGELGAALLTGHLRPARATLHLAEADHRQTLVALKLIPDSQGSIDLIRFVGGEPDGSAGEVDGIRLASPLLIHAELVRSVESARLRETAQIITERYLLQLLTGTPTDHGSPTQQGL